MARCATSMKQSILLHAMQCIINILKQQKLEMHWKSTDNRYRLISTLVSADCRLHNW